MGILLLAGLVLVLCVYLTSTAGETVIISVDGEVLYELPLVEDTELLIETEDGNNLLIIQNGRVWMEEADCPDKLCVEHSAISRSGQSIICLPHKVVVSISGNSEAEVDQVT